MNNTETTHETTYTCPETGVTINANFLAGDHGSLDGGDCMAEIRLVRREDEDTWLLEANDVRQGDGRLLSEWHKRDIVVSLWKGEMIVIHDSDLPKIWDALKPLCPTLRTIEDGHSIEWNGHNHVGRFEENAHEAWEEIDFYASGEGLGMTGSGCTQKMVELFQTLSAATWGAGTWAWDYLTNGLDDDELRDPGLAEKLIKDAQRDEVRLFGSIQNVIDEVIADRKEADADHNALDDTSSPPRAAKGARLDAGAAPD